MKIESGRKAAPRAVPKARVRTNVKNLVKFFSEKDRHGQARDGLEVFGAENFLELARLYLEHAESLQDVLSYARRFKQAVREMTEDDVLEAQQLLAVTKVMES